MASSDHGMDAVGALIHVGGSVLIVYGQVLIKVAHCVAASAPGGGGGWAPPPGQPRW
jgi:hypothetical protein